MAELKKHIYDENNGLHYTLVADCYIPDLKLPEDESRMNELLSFEFNIDIGCVNFVTLTVAGFPLTALLFKMK